MFKIFQNFSIYTVRTAELKKFCDFVEINYRELQSHSKTRWLSLLPSVERVLQMYPALQSYFKSISQPPKFLWKFFSHDFSEAFLYFVHSFMAIFHEKIEVVEREKNSVLEVVRAIDKLLEVLNEKIKSRFIPHSTKLILNKLREQCEDKQCDEFIENAVGVYKASKKYLELWTESFSELKVFKWLDFDEDTELEYESIEETIDFLKVKRVSIDDSIIFDQFVNLKCFLKQKNAEFFHLSASAKISEFFKKNKNKSSCSELLKVAEFFFSIPAHNATVERIFSLINIQWSDERNKLYLKTVRHIVTVQFNLKHFTRKEFYNHLLLPENLPLLRKVGSNEKYSKQSE